MDSCYDCSTSTLILVFLSFKEACYFIKQGKIKQERWEAFTLSQNFLLFQVLHLVGFYRSCSRFAAMLQSLVLGYRNSSGTPTHLGFIFT